MWSSAQCQAGYSPLGLEGEFFPGSLPVPSEPCPSPVFLVGAGSEPSEPFGGYFPGLEWFPYTRVLISTLLNA